MQRETEFPEGVGGRKEKRGTKPRRPSSISSSRIVQSLVAALAHQHEVRRVVAAALAQCRAVVHLAAHACGEPSAPVVAGAHSAAHRAASVAPGYGLLPCPLVLRLAVRVAPRLPLPARGIALCWPALGSRSAPAALAVRHDPPAVRAERPHAAATASTTRAAAASLRAAACSRIRQASASTASIRSDRMLQPSRSAGG